MDMKEANPSRRKCLCLCHRIANTTKESHDKIQNMSGKIKRNNYKSMEGRRVIKRGGKNGINTQEKCKIGIG
jgi:hypothetical protein